MLSSDRRRPPKLTRWSGESDAYVLERMRVASQGSQARPLPISERISSRLYRLTFKGGDGKVLFDGF